MKKHQTVWILGLLVTLAVILIPIFVFVLPKSKPRDDPWSHVPKRPSHVDHTDLLKGPFQTGSEVTKACLQCHEEAAKQVMQTVHWTWESKPYFIARRNQLVTIGKKNTPNNFCLGIQSNWPGCTICHAGYGWVDANFDFSAEENVDCLVCHDQTGTYVKSQGGYPAEGVDLLAVARSVGTPNRANCGGCHFEGGGGNAVKHADLDLHLIHPPETVDVHMGRYDFLCVDCHRTENHVIRGRALSVSLDLENQVSCTDCHNEKPHVDERLNFHTASVSCQTCHIPYGAVKDPTKVYWDWSTAGQDYPEDPHVYLKIKGSFVYDDHLVPEYHWFSGIQDRYLFGDVIDPTQVTVLNPLKGDITDPQAKIHPFKVHRAKQPYDTVYNYLLQPKTVGEGGFWTDFDWDQALRLGSQATGLPYSGQYGFAETIMYWQITHLVAPIENALQCNDCHAPQGRLDWIALGYPGDPMEWGGRFKNIPQP